MLLRYFESSPAANVPAGTLALMALALKTTPLVLLGGDVARPPGHGRAGRHPVLEELTKQQCEAHLAVGGVGRIVSSSSRGPAALPVNFEFTEGESSSVRMNPKRPPWVSRPWWGSRLIGSMKP